MGNCLPVLFSGKLRPCFWMLSHLSFVAIFLWYVSQWHLFAYKALNSCWTSKAQHSSHWKKYNIFSIFCSHFAGGMNIVIKGLGLYCIQCSERGSYFSSCCCMFFVLSEMPGHKWVFCDYDSNAQQWYKINGSCSNIWYQNRLRD